MSLIVKQRKKKQEAAAAPVNWREDATIIRIMKLRKRHVRLALERIEKAKREANQPRACAVCSLDAKAVIENGVYKGHECAAGHFFYVTKRVRDPSAPIVPTEKADPRGMPSGGKAPPPLSAQEVKSLMSRQQEIQKNVLAKTGERNWLKQQPQQ